MTDQQTERTTHRIPWSRRLIYLAILLYAIAVAAHFLGYSFRAYWFSVLGGYVLAMVVIFKIGDFIVYRYLVGDSND